MATIHFAICADRNIEIGLHVTLFSAMNSLNEESQAVAHLFLKGFDDKRVQALKSTVRKFGERCEIKIYDATQIDVGQGIGLHGNKMPYVLFQIPRLVETERIICLDSDLLITTDLANLFDWNLEEKAIGVVPGTKVKNCLPAEANFLMSIGVSGDANYFNTGVVLIDVTEWQKQGNTDKCLKFALSHSAHLYTADQTVFNAVFSDGVALLPKKYNKPHYPTKLTLLSVDEEGIHHFLGSPKPWDFMGEFLNVNYPTFHKYLLKTHYKKYKSFKNLSMSQFARTINLKGPYYRAIKSRFKK